jgi:hypothetical protein
MILEERRVVNFCKLILGLFRNRYTAFLENYLKTQNILDVVILNCKDQLTTLNPNKKGTLASFESLIRFSEEITKVEF